MYMASTREMYSAVKTVTHCVKAALIPARLWARVIALLWAAICILILTHTLLQLGRSARAVSDALDVQMIFMLCMSYPLGDYADKVIYYLVHNRWPYSDGDIRSIVCLWLTLFCAGYFQWFVLPRAIAAIWYQIKRRYE